MIPFVDTMSCCLQKEKAAIQSYFAINCSWKTVMLKENKSWSVSRLENLLRRTCVTTHFSITIEEKRDECWKRWIKYPVLNMIIFWLTSSSGFFNDNSTSWINSERLVWTVMTRANRLFITWKKDDTNTNNFFLTFLFHTNKYKGIVRTLPNFSHRDFL